MRAPAWILVIVVGVAWLLTQPTVAIGAPDLPEPSGWPLTGAIRVLKDFDPPAQRWGRGHRGVDLAAEKGDPVLAAAAGKVTFAARLAGRGVVVVDHGAVRTTYEPVAATVAKGDRVSLGAVIGAVGSGGHCGGRCLHWGLRAGEVYLDPLRLGEESGPVRLLPRAQRAVAAEQAADRAAAAERAADVVPPSQVMAQDFAGSVSKGGFRRPVAGPVTSAFGMRFHPILHTWKLHDGTDFGAPCGAPIRAPADGVVRSVSYNAGYGKRLMLDHGTVSGRRVVTGYNHASSYSVRSGQKVSRGQLIGRVGTTGYSTGCHLHLIVWLGGRLTNPMTWF